MRKIEKIELENFKSYRGFREIPFKNFTAIIGPNGSGKSNIMDAISFVLGVASHHLRGQQLNDLIYKFSEKETPPSKFQCYVRLFFVDETEKLTIFRREIKVKKKTTSCVYFIDDESCTWEEYLNGLHSLNIFPRLKNFLIFQGGVEDVAQMSGKQITELIETLSRSGELKENYDSLLQKEKEAKDSTMFTYQKRKGMTAERKQFKEQKEEADNYKKLLENIQAHQIQRILLQLYYMERDLLDIDKKILTKNKKIKEIEDNQKRLLSNIKKRKKEQAKAHQDSLDIQMEIRNKQKQIDSKRPGNIQTNEELAFLERKIRDGEYEIKRAEKACEDQEAKIVQLNEDLKDIDEQEKELEEKIREEVSQEVILTPDQIQMYNRTKEEAGRKSAVETQQLQQIDREQTLDTSNLESLLVQQKELQGRKEELERAVDQYKTKSEKIEEDISDTVLTKNKLQQEYNEIVNANEEAKSQQTKYSDRLREIHQTLNEAKADMESNDKRKRFEEAIEALKRLFTGVFGRIIDLAQPKHSNYNLAMTVALSNHMDSVVVKDEKTAIGCISYMREQRIGTATFLPIDSLTTRPIDDSLRSLGKNVHPVIDVINFDKTYLRAMEYVCGSTLVVETLEQARKFAYGKERRKVVTLDGTLIMKSGIMTGGKSRRIERHAKRWEQKEMNKLKKERDSLMKKLTEIGAQLRSHAREQQLGAEISRLEANEKSIRYEHQLISEKLEKANAEISQIDKQLKTLSSQIRKVESSIDSRKSSIQNLKNQIREIEDEVFQEFSQEVGITNFREYEERRNNRLKMEEELRLKFSTNRSRIQHLLEYEKQRNVQKNLETAKSRVKEDKKSLRKLRKKREETKEEVEQDNREMTELQKKYQKSLDLALEKNINLKDVKKQLDAILKATIAHTNQITAYEHQLEQIRTKRHDLYLTCIREDINIDVKEGSLPEDIEIQTPEELAQIIRDEDNIVINYKKLSEDARDLNKAQQEESVALYQERIKDYTAQLESISPNMKAIEHLKGVEKKIDETNTKFEESKKLARSAINEFQQVKNHRARRFMKAYDHISKQIDVIYKDLNGGTGAAYLTPDNWEEPYLHGITYNPMPPNKPFGDIENLSGGEKSVAALALLFALHSYKPAPFFILDEIDAALDPDNVNRVGNYIKKKSSEMQIILISLKDKCFEKADGLVGVCINGALDSSETLTFDLTKYPSS